VTNAQTFYPPVKVSLPESDTQLQKVLDSFGPSDGSQSGGILYLPRGEYFGNITVNWPFTQIVGDGDGSRIHGKILCKAGYCTFDNFWAMGTGQHYGIRLSQGEFGGAVPTAGVPRVQMNRVRIGATFEGAGDGPFNGLELDGAIVCDFRKCVFSFGTGSGVYITTTGGAGGWSTNVNHFRGCAMNGNSRYGAEIIGGGVMGPSFMGGNIESNGLGAFTASTVTGLQIRGVDFENGVAHTVATLIAIQGNCNPFVIHDCNITLGDGQSVTSRGILVSGSNQGSIRRNRFSGFNPGRTVPIVTVGADCANVIYEPGGMFDSAGGANNFVDHRGYWV
jgi:hypothetical protein